MTDIPRENVQSYPRPPALEPVPHRITIRFGGLLVADTTRALRVLETHHAPSYYVPPDDIQAALRTAEGSSFCEWKGVARYLDVIAGGKTSMRAAWTYDRPTARPPALPPLQVIWHFMLGSWTKHGLAICASSLSRAIFTAPGSRPIWMDKLRARRERGIGRLGNTRYIVGGITRKR